MASRPSAIRQSKLMYPTPLIGDVLFSERVVAQTRNHPAYGTYHPNTARWPDHKLVLVKEREEPDAQDVFEYFYAADRSTQDLYNWTHSEADIGGNKYDAVTRNYMIMRDTFTPDSPEQGTSMEDTPEGMFSGDYVLASRTAVESPEAELSSLYIFEKRVYVKKVVLIDIEINRETGTAQQIISELFYRGESLGGSTIENLVDDVDNAYWELDENGFGNVAKQLSENWWEVTQRQWINLEDIWEWELDRRGPKKFYCPADETSETETTANNAVGPYSPLPDVAIGTMVKILKWGKYMRYTTISRNAAGLRAVDELSYMPDDGYAYPIQNELVSDDEVPNTRQAITAEGETTEYEVIEGCLAVKATKQALSLEDETQEAVSKLVPEKFLESGSVVSTLVETFTTAITLPETVAVKEEAVLSNKGKIYKLKTTTQEGQTVQLEGAEVNTTDGLSYATTEEVVLLENVTQEDMDGNGNVTTFTPIDATHAIKTVKNALSVEDETQNVSNRLPPDKFFEGGGKPKTVTEIEINVIAPALPAFGLDEAVQRTSKGTIHQTKTTTFENGLVPVPLPSTSFDQRTGIGYLEYQEVVPFEDAIETEVGEDGTVEVFEPYNTDYAIKTTKRVASPETRTWTDIVNYEWPPVLENLYIKTYEKRNGTVLAVPVIKFRSAFTGPQEVAVTQYWQKEVYTPVSPQQMIPKGLRFQCMYFTVDLPPCLHGVVDFAVSTGTNDPVWEPYSETESFEATNFTDWPNTIEWSESKPYMGGYLVTEWVINKPS